MSTPGRTWDVEAVTTAFDLGSVADSPRAVARGAMGWIWRFETTRGVWAVKHLFGAADPGAIGREVRFVTRARDAGVAAPAVVPTVSGNVLAIVPDTARGQAYVRVYEWIDSDTSPRSPVGRDDAARAGETLALMHIVGEACTDPPDDWYIRRLPDRTWSSTVARLHEADDPLAEAFDTAIFILDVAERAIGRVRGPWRICHRDFHPENVLLDAGGRFVVVDWEDTGPLQAEAEIAYTLVAWATRPDGDPDLEAVRALLGAYMSRRRLPRPAGPEVFCVDLITRLNYIDVMIDVALDNDADATERARARSVAELVLERLPRPDVLAAFLGEWQATAR